MFGRANFRDCIADGLKGKGYGEKRTKEVLDIFERRVQTYDRAGMGHPQADEKAMRETFDELTFRANAKANAVKHNFSVVAETSSRVVQGADITTSSLAGDRGAGISGGLGVGTVYGAASMMRADPRVKGLNYESVAHSYFGKYWALMSDVLDNFSKGAFGVQKGAAHFPNIARELFGIDTGDIAAKEIGAAYSKVTDVMMNDFTRNGGMVRRLTDFVMPQRQNRAKLIDATPKEWIDNHLNWLDWNKVMRDNGDLIPPDERVNVLREVYNTLKSDGATKLSSSSFTGGGKSIGNQLDKHRFLVYKDADSWLAMHEAYGDGTVYDVIAEHMLRMSRTNAQVQMFGTNPALWIDNAKALIRKQVENMQSTAQSLGKTNKKTRNMMVDADSAIRRIEDVFAGIMHQNSMDTHSKLGAAATTTSNLLMAAQLGSASVVAIPGDLFTAAAVRALNHTPFAAGLDTYLKGMAPGGYGNLERMMARAGFVFDETVSSTYAAERFSGMTTYAAPISRRIGDVALRLSALTRHTNTARATAQLEQMGMMDEFRSSEWENLPFQHVMERYGITKHEWDLVRKLQPSSPNGGTSTFLRPLDILDTNWANRDQVFQKFFSFVDQESKYMVPASTIEASVVMKGLTRPDTMAGLILQSFAMYKNYPLTFAMNYGRLALSRPGTMTRVKFVSGLVLGMTLVGAMGTQINELLRGRTPIPMNSAAFWGKAFMKGGASGILGDYFFSGTTEYGKDLKSSLMGPQAGLVADTLNLTVGTVFNWVKHGDFQHANLGTRAVQYAKQYTPGSSLWYSRLVVEREIWDSLQELVDPKARQKFQARMRKQKQDFGNAYWWQPGEQRVQ